MHSLLHVRRGYHMAAVVPHYVLPPTGLTSVLYPATAVTVDSVSVSFYIRANGTIYLFKAS